MKNITNTHLLSIVVYLILGIMIGIVLDKDWLSHEEKLYVQHLKSENELLIQEKQAWVRYVEDEFNQIRVFTNADHEEFQNLNKVLANVGVTLEKLPETVPVFNQHGIIISLGDSLEDTYGLPQLTLEDIPNHDGDLTLLYLSLLRMKEELLQ